MDLERPALAGPADEALPMVFRDHYAALVRFAYLLTSDAELSRDLAQEAFVRAWTSWKRIRDKSSLPAWLRGTVVNLARMSWRRRMLELRRGTAPPEDVWMDEDRLLVRAALRALPVRQRACVVLRYFEDLSEQQTARVLGVSTGTVKSQTYKALRRLRSFLGDD